MTTFKEKYDIDHRRTESADVLRQHPDRIPIICERGLSSTLPHIDRRKFLVPKDLTYSAFLFVIRNRISLSSEQALFVMFGDDHAQMASGSTTMSEIYDQYKSDDGFLYATYLGENTFG